MQITTYGVISFRAAFNYYHSRPFPITTNDILIAPFWDYTSFRDFFHLQGSGQVLFRLSDNQTLLNEVGSTINDIDTLEFVFTPTMLFIVTWNGIPQYYGGNKNNVIIKPTLLANDKVICDSLYNYEKRPYHLKFILELLAGDFSK